MSYRKKVKESSPNASKSFANWLSQICAMIMPRFLYMIAGRGSAKTTDIQVERLMEMVYDMPGAPVVWVSDTYANLQKNVLRTVMEGLELKGFKEDIHYVVGKKPPEHTEAEKSNVDASFRSHFWRPHNKLASYKHTMIFFTGLNITFGSLDRPASLAGGNYVHVFGDEAKYFKEERINNLLKAIRGFRVKYGNSVFYRGRTFTTDMPDTAKIGQYDWILKQGKTMSAKAIMLVLKTAFIMNEAANEYVVAAESGTTEDKIRKHRTWQRWVERWIATRLHKSAHTFFYIASSYVNVDILTPDWFADDFSTDFFDSKTAVLSMRPGLEKGEMFYANLQDHHFYKDGSDPKWSQQFGLGDKEDCRILKRLDRNKAIDAGLDFGNMNSMIIAQEGTKYYNCLKFIHTLSPEHTRHLADKFVAYFKPQKEKTLNLYYDRAGNNFNKQKQDLASKVKKQLETTEGGKRTGWTVNLMSVGQANIDQNEEYIFMMDLLTEQNHKLPKVRIDFFHCKEIRSSLEMAPAKKNSKDQMVKDKKSEHKPLHKLPLESTNPSDSFKYLLMRKVWRRLVNNRSKPYTGTASIR